jgi:hypothetical protein
MQNDSTSLLNCPFRLYEFTNIDNFAIEPKNFNKSLFIAEISLYKGYIYFLISIYEKL